MASATTVVDDDCQKGTGGDQIQNSKDLNEVDDDVVELVDISDHAGVSKPGTTSTVGCSTTVDKSRSNDNKKKVKMDDFENVEQPSKKFKSAVWKYYERVGIVDGVEKCECKRCHGLYTCKSDSGTTHLKRHVLKCFKSPEFQNVSALFDNKATFLGKYRFDPKEYRDALSRGIIKHDLPFNYAEYDGINAVNKVLNPDFKPISRNTLKDDCLLVYHSEKAKLKSLLVSHSGRICLTSDCWTAMTSRGYMSVTAHFIDSTWKLNSRLLAFCELDTPHSGLELSSKLLGVLKDWGIESKIFSLTLDNASSNDSMVRILKDRLNLQDGLLCEGEFFHVRCCSHFLNLIVQEGLKVVDDALKMIRNSVKYVKASDGRLREFQKCVEEVNLGNVGGAFLSLDVPTRWNSTYMMLESAIKYRRAFTSLSYSDTNYKYCPSNVEWERGERICTLLAPFNEITNLISGSSYPTSSIYFRQVARIEMKLHEFLNSEDEVIRDMAKWMKVKFDKYWDSYSTTLALGNVLDPRRKMQYLTFVCKRLYPDNHEEKVKIVRDALYKLFLAYGQNGVASNSTIPSMSSLSSPPNMAHFDMDEYDVEFLQESLTVGKSELDVYLDESLGPPGVLKALDPLEYWKTNAHRFPRLSKMASDILSIPITTVASESTFSIGGRILNKYRNCLLPENVQALICARNWLHGFTVDENLGAKEVEEIHLSKQDSNVVDA